MPKFTVHQGNEIRVIMASPGEIIVKARQHPGNKVRVHMAMPDDAHVNLARSGKPFEERVSELEAGKEDFDAEL